MGSPVFHVRKFSLGPRRKYRVSTDDGGHPGDLLAYAETELRASDGIVLYCDETRAARLAEVRASSAGLRAARSGYEVFSAEGARLGSFGLKVRKSIERTTWEVTQPGFGSAVGTERSREIALARRLIGFLGGTPGEIINSVMKYHFDFAQDGRALFSVDKPKVMDDWYRVTVWDDVLDHTLLFALVVTMEVRQRQ